MVANFVDHPLTKTEIRGYDEAGHLSRQHPYAECRGSQAIDGERVLPVTAWVKRWAQAMRQASFEWGANVEARAEQSQIQALPFVDWSAQWLPDKLKPVVHQWQLEQVLPGSSMVQRKKRL